MLFDIIKFSNQTY